MIIPDTSAELWLTLPAKWLYLTVPAPVSPGLLQGRELLREVMRWSVALPLLVAALRWRRLPAALRPLVYYCLVWAGDGGRYLRAAYAAADGFPAHSGGQWRRAAAHRLDLLPGAERGLGAAVAAAA